MLSSISGWLMSKQMSPESESEKCQGPDVIIVGRAQSVPHVELSAHLSISKFTYNVVFNPVRTRPLPTGRCPCKHLQQRHLATLCVPHHHNLATATLPLHGPRYVPCPLCIPPPRPQLQPLRQTTLVSHELVEFPPREKNPFWPNPKLLKNSCGTLAHLS